MSPHLVYGSPACFVSGCFAAGSMPITKIAAYFYLISRLQSNSIRNVQQCSSNFYYVLYADAEVQWHFETYLKTERLTKAVCVTVCQGEETSGK